MVRIEHVRGNTDCLFLPGNCIPVYRLADREWILIDSGSKYDRKELLEYLADNGIAIKAVLTSHAHYDHVGNHGVLRELYGAEIVMTAFDAGCVHDLISLKSCFYSSGKQEMKRYVGEMVGMADWILRPDQRKVTVHGAVFEILPLPGHAASHIGFVTPDGVAYLGDGLQSPEILEKEKMVYSLAWKTDLETKDGILSMPYTRYILSHYGVYDTIGPVVEANRLVYERIAQRVREEVKSGSSLEMLVKQTTASMGIFAGTIKKARVIERIIRSIAEYLVETGELEMGVNDGIVIYQKIMTER